MEKTNLLILLKNLLLYFLGFFVIIMINVILSKIDNINKNDWYFILLHFMWSGYCYVKTVIEKRS